LRVGPYFQPSSESLRRIGRRIRRHPVGPTPQPAVNYLGEGEGEGGREGEGEDEGEGGPPAEMKAWRQPAGGTTEAW